MTKKSEQEVILEVRERLVARFTELPADYVRAAVHRAHDQFANSVVRDFIPLLVERRADRELSQLNPAALAVSA